MTETGNSQVLQTGQRVLWYEIQGILGQGGFGITYRAHDTNLDQAVAIKEYLPSMFAIRNPDGLVMPTSENSKSDFEWGLGRFIDEGRTLARFDHPGIVRVYSVFQENGTAYLVMRYENGQPLDRVLKEHTTLSEARIVKILLDVMDGLEQVHEAGFIHRDIKPANIYLRDDESALLIDFGSARQALGIQTQTLTTLVSPGYAPFEQYYSDGAQQGPWTDIYALGATAFRAMTGRAPMPAVDRSRALLTSLPDSIHEALGASVGYSAGFLNAVEAAIAFQEKDRPQSIGDWRIALAGNGAVPRAVASALPQSMALDIELGSATESIPAIDPDAVTEVLLATEVLAPKMPWYRSPMRQAVGGGLVLLLLVMFAWRPWLSNEPQIVESVTAEVSVAEPAARAGAIEYHEVFENEADQADFDSDSVALVGAPAASEIPATIDDRQTKIDTLLASAAQNVRDGRLTRPADDNAVAKYREVLALDPFNLEASDGLEEIAEHNIERAKRAAEVKDYYLARAHLDEAALADPTHPALPDAHARITDLESTASTPTRTATTAETAPSVTETLARHADRLTNKRTIKRAREVQKALRKNDYIKAFDTFKKSLREY